MRAGLLFSVCLHGVIFTVLSVMQPRDSVSSVAELQEVTVWQAPPVKIEKKIAKTVMQSEDSADAGDAKKTVASSTSMPLSVSAILKNNENDAPPYPLQARLKHQEGRVLVQVQVTPQGVLKQITLQASSGFQILDEAVLHTVKKWKFSSFQGEGDRFVNLPFRFSLKD